MIVAIVAENRRQHITLKVGFKEASRTLVIVFIFTIIALILMWKSVITWDGLQNRKLLAKQLITC